MNKSKILHIIASLNPTHGGPVHGLKNYIPEFYERGMKNEIACLDDPNEEFLQNSVFPIVHALGPCKRPWAYAGKLIPWLNDNIDHFDAIIIHGLWLYHGYAVNKVVKQRRKKKQKTPRVFIMCHGMLDPYFQKASDRKWKSIRNEIYWRLIEANVINNATGILFTCEEELRLAAQTFRNYKPKNVYNIGYGVQAPPPERIEMLKIFAEKCKDLKGADFILFLSRIHEKKGVDLLIKAYKKIIIDQRSGTNIYKPALVIAGPGVDTAHGVALQKMVRESGLEDFVFFPGMLSGDAKWGAFYSCDAFILPSHQENFGIAIAEAMACRKPVLISNKVNIWREIKESDGGFVEDDSLNGTISLLKKWTNTGDDERKIMEENAEKCFHEKFAVQPAVSRMIEVVCADSTNI